MVDTPQRDPNQFLRLAERHLERVRKAVEGPDFSDLGTYGLYCLEALVNAAALKSGKRLLKSHWDKAKEARLLQRKHGFPDVSRLMSDLNDLRKAEAYGDDEDLDTSDFDAEEICEKIEEYYNSVKEFLAVK